MSTHRTPPDAETYDRIQAIIEAGRAADCDARAERGAA